MNAKQKHAFNYISEPNSDFRKQDAMNQQSFTSR